MTKRSGPPAILLAVCLAVTACGGAGSGNSAEGGSGDGGSPIKIMQINLPPVNGQNLQAGVKAAVKSINADGGIDGHQVKYVFCSSGKPPLGDPNTTVACARKAVQEHVVALVGSFNIFTKQVYPIIDEAHTPNIIGIGAVNADNTDKGSFVTVGTGYTIIAGQGFALARAGCEKPVVITRSGIPTDPQIVGAFNAGAKAGGAQPVKAILVPSNVLDFSAPVARARSEGADCIGNGYPTTAQTQPILQAIKKSGGNMKVAVNVSVLSQSALKALGPLGEGVIGADTAYINAPATPDDTKVMTPEQKRMVADLKKFAPAGLQENHQPWAGYVATRVFEAAAKRALAHGQPLTGKSIRQALVRMDHLKTGIVPPLDFTEPGGITCEPRVFNAKVNLFKVKDGEITATSRKSFDMSQALSAAPALNSLC
ncbi:MAG: ABC transporter substrate-binding protein [Streptosporangiaceae bacterium]